MDDYETVNKYINALGGAIKLAARTRQTRLGVAISEHSLNIQRKRGIMFYYWLDPAISSADLHGDGELFLELLTCRARLESHWYRSMIKNGLVIDSTKSLRDISRSTMFHLLRKGYVDTNQFGHEIPLELTI